MTASIRGRPSGWSDFLGSGGILGGIAGGLLTGFLAEPGRPEDLLYMAAALLAAGAASVAVLFRRLDRSPSGAPAGPSAAPAEAGFADSFRTVRGDSYLRALAGLAHPDRHRLHLHRLAVQGGHRRRARGQGQPGLVLRPVQRRAAALTFVFQLVLTSRFLGRFGLRPGLMIYPLALLACSAGVGAWPLLGWALAIKGADKAFSYSIHQSTRELLYIPVAAERKYRAKVFIDMFLNRFSKTIGAGLLLLLFLLPGGRDIRVVSAASAALIALWIALNVRIGRAYGRAVNDRLSEKWKPGEGLVAELADAETAKAILDAMESRRRSPSLYALHLYDMAREGS